jgi:hypothetical protein
LKYALPALLFLLFASSAHAQTTDFVDSLFHLYPKETPYPEDVNFEVETDSTMSISTENDQCIMQRWLHYPSATIVMAYAPDDCAFFAPALKTIAINGKVFALDNVSLFQNPSDFCSRLSWYTDEAWHKLTLGKANYYYTHLTISNCNGTTCSFTLTVIFREQSQQYTAFFFCNTGADLEVIDVDQDEFPDIVETNSIDEASGSFSTHNNRTDIRWLELSNAGKFEAVKDAGGQLYQISVRYPDWDIKSMKILQYHWPAPHY